MVKSRKAIINEILNRYEGKILDVGCTFGSLVDRDGVVGLDILPAKRDLFCQGDAESLPFKDEIFDVIVAGELIEHLFNPTRFLRDCYRILKDKGILIITTPNRKSWWERIFRVSDPEVRRENPLKIIVTSKVFKKLVGYKSIAPPEYEPYGHKQVLDKKELLNLCCSEGLFSSRGFFTTLCFGWNSKIGTMVSRFKSLVHSLLPESLHESMIVILEKR